MKKRKTFKIIFHYLKDEKLRLIIYLLLVMSTYLPVLLSSFFWGFAIEGLINNDYNKFLIFLLLRESAHILFYCVLSIPRDIIYNYLEIKFSKNVIKDIYKKITNLPAIAFEKIGVGEFINRMTNDPDRVMSLLSKLVKMICRSIVIIVVLIISIKASWILGLEIIVFAIIMAFISYKFFPKIKNTQEKIKKYTDVQVKTATENITGIREIKALGIKNTIERRMYDSIDNIFKNQRKINRYEIAYWNINSIVYYILQAIILITSGYFVITNKLSYALFIVLESYIWRIDELVESLSDFGINYNKVKVSLNRIDEIINNRLYKDEVFGKEVLNDAKGIIEFKDVKFKYNDEEEYTLNGLNLKIEPNKKIAIVGKSGNGKSTLFNLLIRYFDSTEGIITIDGKDITKLTEESLRNNISIIRQSPFLFNLSILDNFRLVKEDATLEEIRKVCKKAYIDDYIMSLPEKYDTLIGEGGVNLSGGQKQRIAIARTLLINTKIILFDEATSALDNESQEYIKKTIDNLIKDHTVVIIAHRLSTIIDSDKIYVINKGLLESSGTHEELLKKSKTYNSLYLTDINN